MTPGIGPQVAPEHRQHGDVEHVQGHDCGKREPESAFTPLVGVDLELLLSIQHERVVQKDNTVIFGRLYLQLPKSATRPTTSAARSSSTSCSTDASP